MQQICGLFGIPLVHTYAIVVHHQRLLCGNILSIMPDGSLYRNHDALGHGLDEPHMCQTALHLHWK